MQAKTLRQQTIVRIVQKQAIRNQRELVQALERHHILTNQATVSRDLAELNLSRSGGVYVRTPVRMQALSPEKLEILPAGDNLLVIKTAPSLGPRAASLIDHAQIPGVVGTVAGDDTIFVACASVEERERASARILQALKQQFIA